jgi:MoaA/NifB/PqqE/SkfB family radical SAM enzyme
MKILHIENTTYCNLRCRHCRINSAEYVREHMPFSLFEKLFGAMEKYRPLVILNGHGEPLMHPQWLDMFSAAMQRGGDIEFQSNCQLLTPSLCEKMLSIPGFWARLKVSIEGVDKGSYEANRVNASWDRLCENMEYLAAQPKRPALSIEFVVMRSNLHMLPDAARLAAKWKCDRLQISDLFTHPTLPEMRALDAETLCDERNTMKPMLEEAKAVCDENGIRIETTTDTAKAIGWPVAPTGKKRHDVACLIPFEVAFIEPSGNVLPCCRVRTPVGNLAEADLDAIWNGAPFEAFRETMRTRKLCEACRLCACRRDWK